VETKEKISLLYKSLFIFKNRMCNTAKNIFLRSYNPFRGCRSIQNKSLFRTSNSLVKLDEQNRIILGNNSKEIGEKLGDSVGLKLVVRNCSLVRVLGIFLSFRSFVKLTMPNEVYKGIVFFVSKNVESSNKFVNGFVDVLRSVVTHRYTKTFLVFSLSFVFYSIVKNSIFFFIPVFEGFFLVYHIPVVIPSKVGDFLLSPTGEKMFLKDIINNPIESKHNILVEKDSSSTYVWYKDK